MKDEKEREDYLLDICDFTPEMKKTHTILVPAMLEFHFKLLEAALNSLGYKTEILTNNDTPVVTTGLRYVHNDTCYPALCVIGQFIEALKVRNDLDKVALIITQTGGGCRATNYVPLLRKALKKAGFQNIPIIVLNLGNLRESRGIKLNLKFLSKLVAAITYGDTLMYLHNKTRTYEVTPGSAYALVNKWIDKLGNLIRQNKGTKKSYLKKYLPQIVDDFNNLPIKLKPAPKVGIVGEIYVKYSPIGNNHLEEFLVSNGAEINVPGLFGFVLYCLQNSIYDYGYYGGKHIKLRITNILINYLEKRELLIIKALKDSKFGSFTPFKEMKDYSKGIIKHGAKMGEGWLLTAEMIELIDSGFSNIVLTQPFGCLPNHICGKGVMKKIKSLHNDANIVAIDYDSSASKVNQENRIKLMLAIARENIEK